MTLIINQGGLTIRAKEMLNKLAGMQNQRCPELNPCFADDIITGWTIFADDIITGGTMMAVSAKLRWNAKGGCHQCHPPACAQLR